MKGKILCLIPFAIGLCLWMKDGLRLSPWATSVEKRLEVPILEGMPEWGTQTTSIWEERFLFGIETPIISICASALLLAIGYIRKQSFNHHRSKS